MSNNARVVIITGDGIENGASNVTGQTLMVDGGMSVVSGAR